MTVQEDNAQDDPQSRPSRACGTAPPALLRDCALLPERGAAGAARFLRDLSGDLAARKEKWIDDILTIQEDYNRASERIHAERYEPARRDELLDLGRGEHLLRLRQALELQNRSTSDWVIDVQNRWRAAIRCDRPDRRRRPESAEAGLLAELIDVTRQSHAWRVLDRGDAAEVAALWRAAVERNDTATLDFISDQRPDDLGGPLAPDLARYRRKRQALRRLERADDLAAWIQRERTVAHAVYDSVAEAIARA